jgi:hypothetical protein
MPATPAFLRATSAPTGVLPGRDVDALRFCVAESALSRGLRGGTRAALAALGTKDERACQQLLDMLSFDVLDHTLEFVLARVSALGSDARAVSAALVEDARDALAGPFDVLMFCERSPYDIPITEAFVSASLNRGAAHEHDGVPERAAMLAAMPAALLLEPSCGRWDGDQERLAIAASLLSEGAVWNRASGRHLRRVWQTAAALASR